MKLTFETLLLALGIVAVAAVFFVEAGTTNEKGCTKFFLSQTFQSFNLKIFN